MTHRAEQIVDAVHAALTGLATTGAEVHRARATAIAIENTPALVVWQGEEGVLQELSGDQLIVGLPVNIDAVAADPVQRNETVLNQIRAEVTAALAGDHKLGLGFVYDFSEQGADDPEPVGDGDRPASRMRLRWQATYRRSRTDPAA